MTLSVPPGRFPRHVILALIAAIAIGAAGAFPHLRWSIESGEVSWFFNSYDEGYYGWLSISDVSPARMLSDGVMRVVYHLTGANPQRAMIAADFFFPAGVVLAACYLTRPLYVKASGMLAGALVVLVSAECLALRSNFIPHAAWMTWFQEHAVPLGGGPAGIFQLGNQTGTFWVFRTPEPQISWIITYVTLGLALRLTLGLGTNTREKLVAACVLAGTGYLFCSLALGGALVLAGAFAIRAQPSIARWIGAGGLVCVGACFGLSVLFARHSGGESLIFASRQPVVMLSAAWGMLAACVAGFRAFRRHHIEATDWLAIALGVAPMCMANQQLVTGRMIYLLNFENFGFAPLSAIACLIAFRSARPSTPEERYFRFAAPLTTAAAIVVTTAAIIIVWRSQIRSFDQYRETNRLAYSYARTLQALPHANRQVACDDFFETDILALLLGERPDFLLCRDTIFSAPIARLKGPYAPPGSSEAPRNALFRYLHITGTSAEEFERRLQTLVDPNIPDWQSRFMLGAFLFNHADFWFPLTHGRDAKSSWISAQLPALVASYRSYLQRSDHHFSVVYIVRAGKPLPQFSSFVHSRQLQLNRRKTLIDLDVYELTVDGQNLASPNAPSANP